MPDQYMYIQLQAQELETGYDNENKLKLTFNQQIYGDSPFNVFLMNNQSDY